MDPFTLLLVAGAGYLLLKGKAKPSIGAMAANMDVPPSGPVTDLTRPGIPTPVGSLQFVPHPTQPIGTVSAPAPRPLPPTQPAPEVSPIGSIGGTVLAPPSPDLISQGDIVQAAV